MTKKPPVSHGYSTRIIELNWRADEAKLGVLLGRACIAARIPVADVASAFGVSRQTVYNWFAGAHNPKAGLHMKVANYIADLMPAGA